jgi:hypothetical protein
MSRPSPRTLLWIFMRSGSRLLDFAETRTVYARTSTPHTDLFLFFDNVLRRRRRRRSKLSAEVKSNSQILPDRSPFSAPGNQVSSESGMPTRSDNARDGHSGDLGPDPEAAAEGPWAVTVHVVVVSTHAHEGNGRYVAADFS